MHELLEGVGESLLGTHFTCFTGTNVQMLAQNALLARHFTPSMSRSTFCLICVRMLGTHFTCFTSTEVQILTPEELASLHLLDVYCSVDPSTKTDETRLRSTPEELASLANTDT